MGSRNVRLRLCGSLTRAWGRWRVAFQRVRFFSTISEAFFFEEGFQNVVVQLLQDAADGLEVVIAIGESTEVERAANAAHAQIREAVIDLANARNDQCARAHRAGLFGDVERALVESPITNEAGRLRNRKDLGVGGGVIARAGLIMRRRDDLPLVFDHCADRHLVLFPCFDRLIIGVGHEVVGIAVER